MHVRWGILALIVCLAAFALTQDKPATDKDKPTGAVAQAAAASGYAYIHVYRARRYMGSALSPTIVVDSKPAVRIGNGRRATLKLTPGAHTITSDDKSSAIEAEFKAGQHYYIRIDEKEGFWKGHGQLTMVMPEQGGAEYKKQKPAEADRRLDKEVIDEAATDGEAGNS
jgi:hypothetical protein